MTGWAKRKRRFNADIKLVSKALRFPYLCSSSALSDERTGNWKAAELAGLGSWEQAHSLAFKKNIANSCPDKNVSLRPKEVVTASERVRGAKEEHERDSPSFP